MKYIAMIALLSLGLLACNEDKKPESTQAPTGAAANNAAPTSAESAPLEEDMEEQADKEITASANLDSELDKLEKEIGQ